MTRPVTPQPKTNGRALSAPVIGIAAAAVLAVAAFNGLLGPGGGDNVPATTSAALSETFKSATIAPAALDPDAAETEELVARHNPLKPAEKQKLLDDARQQRIQLATITLWDSFEEDGDIVSIKSAGFETTLQLTKAPVILTLPYQAGGTLTIGGLRDGGGGITAAIRWAGGEIVIPPFAEGATISIPVM